ELPAGGGGGPGGRGHRAARPCAPGPRPGGHAGRGPRPERGPARDPPPVPDLRARPGGGGGVTAGPGGGEPRRGLPRILGIGSAILLAFGIATAVGDVFRTSRPAVVSGGGEVRLDMRDFNFTPHAIVVEQGRSARVVLRNES